MRILGVDPGLTRCGLAVVDAGSRRQVRLLHVETARSDADAPTPERIAVLANAIEALISTYRPDSLALERVFAQHNVRTVMGTAQISGVVMLAAQRASIPVALYTPSEVKAAVTGDGRAAKTQVGYMVAKVLGLAEPPKPADAADAIAIAITHAWRGGAAPQGSGATTAAQRAWAEAERAARRRQGGH